MGVRLEGTRMPPCSLKDMGEKKELVSENMHLYTYFSQVQFPEIARGLYFHSLKSGQAIIPEASPEASFLSPHPHPKYNPMYWVSLKAV